MPSHFSARTDAALPEGERDPLNRALRDLSEQQRLVVMSKVFDDQTFQAISNDLGISVSSVKTHYLRALQHLRAQLGGKS